LITSFTWVFCQQKNSSEKSEKLRFLLFLGFMKLKEMFPGSPRVKALDEAKKAKIANTFEQWAEHPDRYDIGGMDYPIGREFKTEKGERPHTRKI